MKLIHIVSAVAILAIAFASVSAPVALADGIDPTVKTLGCGPGTGRVCATTILKPGETSVSVSETFNCTGSDPASCTANEDVINETGVAITSFHLAFAPVFVDGNPLSFSCAMGSFSFMCNPLGNNAFAFTGGSLCSDSDDLEDGVFTADGDECGVIIGLQGVDGTETTPGDPFLQGVTVTSTFSTPEPSSAVLLLFGLMAGLVGFKSFRNVSLA